MSGCSDITMLRRWRGAASGFSYVEVVLASVIMSGLLVAALGLFANLGLSQRAVMGKEGAGYLVISMCEEIRTQTYKDAAATDDTLGREAGELDTSRADFDDIDDYVGWSASPPQDKAGQPYDQYANLSRTVAVRYVMADDFSQSAAGDEGFKEVTITISHNTTSQTVEERSFVLADYEQQ